MPGVREAVSKALASFGAATRARLANSTQLTRNSQTGGQRTGQNTTTTQNAPPDVNRKPLLPQSPPSQRRFPTQWAASQVGITHTHSEVSENANKGSENISGSSTGTSSSSSSSSGTSPKHPGPNRSEGTSIGYNAAANNSPFGSPYGQDRRLFSTKKNFERRFAGFDTSKKFPGTIRSLMFFSTDAKNTMENSTSSDNNISAPKSYSIHDEFKRMAELARHQQLARARLELARQQEEEALYYSPPDPVEVGRDNVYTVAQQKNLPSPYGKRPFPLTANGRAISETEARRLIREGHNILAGPTNRLQEKTGLKDSFSGFFGEVVSTKIAGSADPFPKFDLNYISLDHVSNELKEVQKMEELARLQKESAIQSKKVAKQELERRSLEAQDRLAVALRRRAEVIQGHNILAGAKDKVQETVKETERVKVCNILAEAKERVKEGKET